MIDFQYIECEVFESIATITLNRPKHNIMNINMMKEINSELELILNDKSIKCVVLYAEGPSWCAGVEVSEHKPEVVSSMIEEFSKIFQLIHKLEIPTIAAVHGNCLGGGMELAIACDIIIALENAIFGQPEVKLGFFPPYAVVRLPMLVGEARTIEICTTGKSYTAEEAFKMGMISKVVSSSDKNNLYSSVNNILKDIKDCSPLILRLNKRAVMTNSNYKINDTFSQANDLFINTLMKTKDVLEGINSFEQRRKAVWFNE